MFAINKKDYPNPDILDLKDNIVSSTGCTGLIQSAPITEDEVEEYSDIYKIPKQEGLDKL